MAKTPAESAAAEKIADVAVDVAEKVTIEASAVATALTTEASAVAAALVLAAGTTRSALRWIRVALIGITVSIFLLGALFFIAEADRDERRSSICRAVTAVADANEAFLIEAFAPVITPEELAAGRARYRFFIDPALKDCGTPD